MFLAILCNNNENEKKKRRKLWNIIKATWETSWNYGITTIMALHVFFFFIFSIARATWAFITWGSRRVFDGSRRWASQQPKVCRFMTLYELSIPITVARRFWHFKKLEYQVDVNKWSAREQTWRRFSNRKIDLFSNRWAQRVEPSSQSPDPPFFSLEWNDERLRIRCCGVVIWHSMCN